MCCELVSNQRSCSSIINLLEKKAKAGNSHSRFIIGSAKIGLYSSVCNLEVDMSCSQSEFRTDFMHENFILEEEANVDLRAKASHFCWSQVKTAQNPKAKNVVLFWLHTLEFP